MSPEKTTDSQGEEKPKEQPSLDFSKMKIVDSPEYRTNYAVRSFIAISAAEIRLQFHRFDIGIATEDSAIVRVSEVIMTPKNAYDFWLFLGSRLKDCSEQMEQFPQDIKDMRHLMLGMEKVAMAIQGLDQTRPFEIVATQKD